MEQNYLSTDNLAVGYNHRMLISDIRIELKRGEIMTLIGPNGAGKSTILKTIIGQLEKISGVVSIENQEMQSLSRKEIAKKMAILMTGKVRPELMTCRDVVATGRYPYTGSLGILSKADQQKIDEAIALVHAEDFANQDFDKISDGQMQRILLARCICQEPEIIVLDEPTSYLDIKHKLELLHILKNLVKEKQIAVLMSLHEIDLAQKISDKIVCIKGDKIDKMGSPEEIFEDSYIADLYGITVGSYQTVYGGMELAKVEGEPKVFVISGGGKGIPVYRKLQREGIPFASGILWENDVEYAVAKALACEVISVKAFCEISEMQYQRAYAVMEKCEKVICTFDDDEFGELGKFNKKLKVAAERFKY